jgi:hypothetical protein
MRWPSPASRIVLAALAVSLAVHGALLVGVPAGLAVNANDERPAATYIATLTPAQTAAAPEPPMVKAAVRHAVHRVRVRAPKPHPLPMPEPVLPEPQPVVAQAPAPQPETAPIVDPVALLAPPPSEPAPQAGPVALLAPPPPEPAPQAKPTVAAEPMGPPDLPDAAGIEPDRFPTQALPSDLEIDYALDSAIAKAHAVYRWKRDGDHYRITGEGEADGFFSLFLEGRMVQESEGTVTTSGLKPDRFVEKKPNTQDEGLDFDWKARQVTFDLGDKHKTGKLADNSVDWLSMIFQLAHVPPAEGARDMKLQVLTQRRQYRFDLKVLGTEDIVIPMGRVRALHLRHVDPDDGQAVDVWLGVEQHYLPVKLRYPVARNRLMVEQSATSLSAR